MNRVYDPSVDEYVSMVKKIIRDHKVRTVLEIGCGDFSVAGRYAADCSYYIGVDVVSDLVAYNRDKFGNETITFMCVDATSQEMPAADLCIIRQVFQHISNQDIANILKNTRGCRLLLVTEHLPSVDQLRDFNLDKNSCPDTRVSLGSGVYLEHAPFHLTIDIILDVPIKDYNFNSGERLRTVLISKEPTTCE